MILIIIIIIIIDIDNNSNSNNNNNNIIIITIIGNHNKYNKAELALVADEWGQPLFVLIKDSTFKSHVMLCKEHF